MRDAHHLLHEVRRLRELAKTARCDERFLLELEADRIETSYRLLNGR